MLREADLEDHDGRLNYEEFVRFVDPAGYGAQGRHFEGKVRRAGELMIAHLKIDPDSEVSILEAFKPLDSDHNGFVSYADLRHVLTNLDENLTDEEVGDVLRAVDAAPGRSPEAMARSATRTSSASSRRSGSGPPQSGISRRAPSSSASGARARRGRPRRAARWRRTLVPQTVLSQSLRSRPHLERASFPSSKAGTVATAVRGSCGASGPGRRLTPPSSSWRAHRRTAACAGRRRTCALKSTVAI